MADTVQLNPLFGEMQGKPQAAGQAQGSVSGYSETIAGTQAYSEYRLGKIKDVYRHQPTMHLAVKEYRADSIRHKEQLGKTLLGAYLSSGDPNALNQFMANDSSLGIERDRQFNENWAESTYRNPDATPEARDIARSIFAKEFKPYGVETELAQFGQFMAAGQSSEVAGIQGQMYGNSTDGNTERMKILADMKMRKDEAQMKADNDLRDMYFKGEVKSEFKEQVENYLKKKLPHFSAGGTGEFI